MSYFPERPNQNLHAFAFSHRRGEHARIQHKPAVIWMTGISASGKSTSPMRWTSPCRNRGGSPRLLMATRYVAGCAGTWVLPTATVTRISGGSPRSRD